MHIFVFASVFAGFVGALLWRVRGRCTACFVRDCMRKTMPTREMLFGVIVVGELTVRDDLI